MGKAVVGTDVGRGVGGNVDGETVVGETVLGAKVVGKGNGTIDGGAVVRLWIGDEGVIVGLSNISSSALLLLLLLLLLSLLEERMTPIAMATATTTIVIIIAHNILAAVELVAKLFGRDDNGCLIASSHSV